MHTDLTELLPWQALALFLLAGALLGIFVGVLLIFQPRLMMTANRVASRWISPRHLNRILDRSVSIEHWFYQHHRTVGLAAVSGAVYILAYFGLLFDKAVTIQYLGGAVPVKLLDGLLDALVLSLLVGAAVAFMSGLFLWLRPSLLRGIEVGANRWVPEPRAVRALDVPQKRGEGYVARHARRVGGLLLLGSIYLLFAVAQWLVW